MAVRQQNDLRLYLDVIPDATKVRCIRIGVSSWYTYMVIA